MAKKHKATKNSSRALSMAAIKLGFSCSPKKQIVFDGVALAMNVPSPRTKVAGYLLCEQFCLPVEQRMSREELHAVMTGSFEKAERGWRARPDPVVVQLPKAVVVQLPKACVKRREYRASDGFLQSFEWRQLRMRVLKARGARCECCGASPTDGVTVINVDHIKPRRDYPRLSLVESNLQVLCAVCNHGKGNWDQTDWRQPQRDEDYDIALDTLRRMRVSGEPS